MDILDDHTGRLSSIESELTCNISFSDKTSAKRNPLQDDQLVHVLNEMNNPLGSLDIKFTYQNHGESKKTSAAGTSSWRKTAAR